MRNKKNKNKVINKRKPRVQISGVESVRDFVQNNEENVDKIKLTGSGKTKQNTGVEENRTVKAVLMANKALLAALERIL